MIILLLLRMDNKFANVSHTHAPGYRQVNCGVLILKGAFRFLTFLLQDRMWGKGPCPSTMGQNALQGERAWPPLSQGTLLMLKGTWPGVFQKEHTYYSIFSGHPECLV